MEQVRRWDFGEVGQVERTDQGYLRAPATITKTGVFPYRQADGSIRRELRLPAEVFAPDAMRSFGLAPLTNGHPMHGPKRILLDASNTARYQVGSVSEPRQDGDHVAAHVQITDSEAIKAAEAGRRQLSCGYTCGLEMRSGVTSGIVGIPDGLKFDAIQRGIRGNHVAMTDKGRAGSSVQLRLDEADQVDETIEPRAGAEADIGRPQKTDSVQTGADGRPILETTTMADIQVRIDGVSYDATSQVAEAVAKLQVRLDAAETSLAEAKKKASEQQARADTAEENLAAEKKARADDLSPDKVREAVDARLALERQAAPVLGDQVKLDELDNDAIKRAVVLKVAADAEVAKQRLDEGDATYLAARYDAAIEAHQPEPEVNEGLSGVRTAAKGAARTDAADDARSRMLAEGRELGRKPLRAVN